MADLKISQLTGAATPLAGTEVLPIVQSATTKKVAVSDLTAGRDVDVKNLTVGLGGTGAVLTSITLNGSSNAGYGSCILAKRNSANAWLMGDTQTAFGSGTGFTHYIYGANPYQIYINTFKIFSLDETNGDVVANAGSYKIASAGQGVKFTANTPAAGMTSQLLNWYEEGTWTPTLTGASGSITTYSAQVATYTRVGNMCFVQAYIAISDIGTISGALTLNGLPFTSNTTSNAYQEGHGRANGLNSLTAPANGLIGYQVGNNATIATVQVGTATGVSAMDAAALKNGCDFIVSIAYRVA